jgi:hypothetical protein
MTGELLVERGPPLKTFQGGFRLGLGRLRNGLRLKAGMVLQPFGSGQRLLCLSLTTGGTGRPPIPIAARETDIF